MVPALGGSVCPGYATYDSTTSGCNIGARLDPEGEPTWRVGGSAGVSAGAELLLTRHLALHARLTFATTFWGSQEDVVLRNVVGYTGPPEGTAELTDLHRLPAIEHTVSVAVGMLGYF